jgi:DNA-binding NtrC family response regulator
MNERESVHHGRILVCVTDNALADVMRVVLSTVDVVVDTCASASDAVPSVSERHVQAAFVHAASVGGSIAAFVASLRTVPGHERLPICVIGPHDVASQARANACEFLANPVSLRDLRHMTSQLLATTTS